MNANRFIPLFYIQILKINQLKTWMQRKIIKYEYFIMCFFFDRYALKHLNMHIGMMLLFVSFILLKMDNIVFFMEMNKLKEKYID